MDKTPKPTNKNIISTPLFGTAASKMHQFSFTLMEKVQV